MVVEVTEPVDDIVLDRPDEPLQVLVLLEGEPLGRIELPVAGGRVPAETIRAAIANEFASAILARYFARTAYAPLERRTESTGWSWWRGERLVARAEGKATNDSLVALAALHDAIGWETLVEALFPSAHPLVEAAWKSIDRLVESLRDHDDGRAHGMPRRRSIEVGDRLPAFVFGRRNVTVELRIGDTVVSSMEYVVGRAGIATGRALRGAVTDAAFTSLSRAVVREALIGVPLDATPLRERMARGRARADESARAR